MVYRTDVPVPRPGADELLVQVRAAGVNNTDINTRTGWYAATEGSDASWTGDALVFPRIQGADVCGVVVAVGSGVPESRVGERVIVQGCLRSLGRDGREPWLGSELDGGFAQFVRTPAADTYRVDCALPDVQLAAVPCSYADGREPAPPCRRAGRRARARHRRIGRGRVGRRSSSPAAAAPRWSPSRVTPRPPPCRARGGDRCAAHRHRGDKSAGSRSTSSSTSSAAPLPELLAVLRTRGRYATSGAIGGPVVELDLRTLYLKDLTLYGCTSQDAEVFPNLVRYLEPGELEPLVSATFPLRRHRRGSRRSRRKLHVGKIVLGAATRRLSITVGLRASPRRAPTSRRGRARPPDPPERRGGEVGEAPPQRHLVLVAEQHDLTVDRPADESAHAAVDGLDPGRSPGTERRS